MLRIPFFDKEYISRFYTLDGNIKKISLYTGEKVNYELKTDGMIASSDIRIDKWPHYHDSDLEGITPLKRHDFIINDANIILVQKKIRNLKIQDFYLNNNYLESLLLDRRFIYTYLSFTEKEKLMIKALGDEEWKLRE